MSEAKHIKDCIGDKYPEYCDCTARASEAKPCPTCNGSGQFIGALGIDPANWPNCEVCHGTGIAKATSEEAANTDTNNPVSGLTNNTTVDSRPVTADERLTPLQVNHTTAKSLYEFIEEKNPGITTPPAGEFERVEEARREELSNLLKLPVIMVEYTDIGTQACIRTSLILDRIAALTPKPEDKKSDFNCPGLDSISGKKCQLKYKHTHAKPPKYEDGDEE